MGPLLVILIFTYYLSVAQDKSFKRGYPEMAAVFMGVAAASFFIGLFLRLVVGVDVQASGGGTHPRYLRQVDVVHVAAMSLERFFSSDAR